MMPQPFHKVLTPHGKTITSKPVAENSQEVAQVQTGELWKKSRGVCAPQVTAELMKPIRLQSTISISCSTSNINPTDHNLDGPTQVVGKEREATVDRGGGADTGGER